METEAEELVSILMECLSDPANLDLRQKMIGIIKWQMSTKVESTPPVEEVVTPVSPSTDSILDSSIEISRSEWDQYSDFFGEHVRLERAQRNLIQQLETLSTSHVFDTVFSRNIRLLTFLLSFLEEIELDDVATLVRELMDS